MATTRTLADLAAEANKLLVRSPDKRGESTNRAMLLPADGAPDWFTDLCRESHDAARMLPDDWRYEFIEDALSSLENGDEDGPDIDSAYPYTFDRLNWLASNLNRPGYCDEAAEEYGMKFSDVLAFIALGMQQEMNETFQQVKAFLEARLEADQDEADEIDAADPSEDEQEAAGE